MTKVHIREGTFLHYDLHFFTLYVQHVVLKRVIPSYTLYYHVFEAKCSIYIGYLLVVCGGSHMILGVHH